MCHPEILIFSNYGILCWKMKSLKDGPIRVVLGSLKKKRGSDRETSSLSLSCLL